VRREIVDEWRENPSRASLAFFLCFLSFLLKQGSQQALSVARTYTQDLMNTPGSKEKLQAPIVALHRGTRDRRHA